MAQHLNEVSKESREIFADVRKIGKRVLERFCEGFAHALKDVCKGWRHLKPRERKIVFEKVQDVAKELIVDKKDGGGSDDGLSLGTFYGYVCKVKRSLIYLVPLSIADRATNQELQKAKAHAEEVLGGFNEDNMVKAYGWVKDEQAKEKERLKEAAAKNNKKKAVASLQTPYTLPDPDDYEEKDSDDLLRSGITGILNWLQAKSLKPHLQKDLQSAKALKHVLGELALFTEEKETPLEKIEAIAV